MKKIVTYWCIGLMSSIWGKTLDLSKPRNLVAYWGQNSYGNSESNGKLERPLGDYCRDSTYDVLVLSFLTKFDAKEEKAHPTLDLGHHCKTKYEGTDHPHCPDVAKDIKFCQEQGKVLLISMGGYGGEYSIDGEEQADKLAERMWDLYLGGQTEHRPFGDAVLDGLDLDIEKGAPESYAQFSNKLHQIFTDNNRNEGRSFYVTAAPQCPFPDEHLKNTLEHGWLDMVFVQFYNNNCGLGTEKYNMNVWDKWAREDSKNKQVKLFLGAPASEKAASSGYLSHHKLIPVIKEAQEKYPSFAGVMLWDVSQANMNLCNEAKQLFSVAISQSLKGEHDVEQFGALTNDTSGGALRSSLKSNNIAISDQNNLPPVQMVNGKPAPFKNNTLSQKPNNDRIPDLNSMSSAQVPGDIRNTTQHSNSTNTQPKNNTTEPIHEEKEPSQNRSMPATAPHRHSWNIANILRNFNSSLPLASAFQSDINKNKPGANTVALNSLPTASSESDGSEINLSKITPMGDVSMPTSLAASSTVDNQSSSLPSSSMDKANESSSMPSSMDKANESSSINNQPSSMSSSSMDKAVESSMLSSSVNKPNESSSMPSSTIDKANESSSMPSSSVNKANESSSMPSSSVNKANESSSMPSSSVNKANEASSMPSSSANKPNESSSMSSSSANKPNESFSMPSSSVDKSNQSSSISASSIEKPPSATPSSSNIKADSISSAPSQSSPSPTSNPQ